MRNVKPETETHLRLKAEALLKAGDAPKSKVAVTGVKALALLYNLAIDPARSADAQKVLHELQVHQVELDMQHEQFEQSLDELTQALDQYVERYDFAPVVYFTVDRDGKIIEGNRAAAELFDVEQAALSGRHIDSLVTSQCRLAVRALLKRLGSSGSRETCEVQIHSGSSSRHFQIVATVSPRDRSFLMVFIETTDRKKLDPLV